MQLTVEALDKDGAPFAVAGSRYFYRCAPWAGPDAYPPKARSYRECALMAYRYVYGMAPVQYWLKHGRPDPGYWLNIYPSKMIAAVIRAMISYASIDPDNAADALQLAKNAADYLLSVTIGGDSPLAGLPPTYRYHFADEEYSGKTETLETMVMMCYPAGVGDAYLALEKATGEGKYFDAARRIAEFYRDHVLENGTWPLMLEIATGESRSANYLMPESVIAFMKSMADRTGEEIWLTLMKNANAYRAGQKMDSYDWEGQFEDSPTSAHYTNLSHYPADSMVYYIAENEKDDPESMAQAEDLMRFIEDQFVVWSRHAPRTRRDDDPGFRAEFENLPNWHTPCGLEQYNWYVPIDSSTAHIMGAFLRLYRANGNPLLLAKARTLADSITRMQNPETGMIPTHWMSKTAVQDGGGLWINCLIETAAWMLEIAGETEKD